MWESVAPPIEGAGQLHQFCSFLTVTMGLNYALIFLQRSQARKYPFGFSGPHCTHRFWSMQRGTGSQCNNHNILWNSWGQFGFLGFIPKMLTREFSIWTKCSFLLSPTVLGTRGASETGLWSHGRLVVLGISTVRDAIWTGEKNLRSFS